MRRGAFLSIVLLAAMVPAASAENDGPAFRADSVRLEGLPKLPIRTRAALDWCGAGQPGAVDRKPDAELSSPRQVHVTYVVPADAAEQISSSGSKIATDVAAMDSWWRGQDPSRTVRFDLHAFSGCTTKYGGLDLGFIRLPRSGAEYVGDAGADRLLNDLGALAVLSAQKHLVYYDGPPVFEPFVCGTAFVPRNAPTQGGTAGIAFVWLRSLCGFDLGAGGLNAAVAVHELIHGLGALTQSGAPNECDAPDDGHVCDSTADVLYPVATSATRIGGQILDANRDDYYGHAGSWFDVQDSGWLTHLPQLTLDIAVQASSRTAGLVQMTAPAPFECRQSCSVPIDTGTAVRLVAVPASRTRFAGWRGACTGTAACTVVLDAGKSVAAIFGPSSFRITTAVTGKGKVTSLPTGIACPASCSASFKADSTVRLRPQPARGYRFVRWAGSCRGKATTCRLKADRDRSARAIFRKQG
jgi:hypothetical protein